MVYKTIVLGTGPAAFGTCLALIEMGIKPIVIDFNFKEKYYVREKNGINFQGTSRNSHKKSLFGDFSMYEIPKEWNISFNNDYSLPISNYPGGLSSVWGANLATLNEENIKPWNSQSSNLKRAYDKLLNVIPHNYISDSLDTKFPWIERKNSDYFTSSRLNNIFNSDYINQNLLVGHSRNANKDFSNGCIKCGRCITGCPENIIFNSANNFNNWINDNLVEYIDGYALSISKNSLTYYSNKLKKINHLLFHKIFIGCGAISSIALLQKSNLIDKKIYLNDTQNFYAPIISLARKSISDPDYSLAQLYISTSLNHELNFHFGIYESSLQWRSIAIKTFGNLIKLVPKNLFDKLLVGIGFIPSYESGKIILETNCEKTNVFTSKNKNSKKYIKKSVAALNKILTKSKFFIPYNTLMIPNPGASFHVGTACLSNEQKLFDLEGQIDGLNNIFVVDGASLPDIQPGPITLTIMANAYRIAINSTNK